MGSEPIDGQALTSPPTRVRLTFNEPVSPSIITVALTTSKGAQVQLAAPTVEAQNVTQPMPALANDGYTVAYRVMSSVDGHPTTGTVKFTVQAPERSLPASTPTSVSGADAQGPPAAAGQESAAGSTPWLIVAPVGAVLLAGLAVIATRTRRRKH